MRRSTLFIVTGILLVAAAGAVYLFAGRFLDNVAVFGGNPQATTSESVTTLRTPPLGYVEYHHNQYRFSFFYPQGLAVSTYDEGGGAATISFQNVQKGEGLQIFVVPYGSTTVSEQRFKEDEPSGVRNNPTQGLIDGAVAAAFYSNDSRLGETYEVWFIHGGYLYEVTTLKPLDTWLQGIMQSWAFI